LGTETVFLIVVYHTPEAMLEEYNVKVDEQADRNVQKA